MSENNLNLYDVLKLSETEQSLVGEKIDRILERLFLNGPGQAGALDENIINGYTKKLCGAFKDPEARKGLLSVCRLLKELEDNHKSTVDIYSSLNGMNIDIVDLKNNSVVQDINILKGKDSETPKVDNLNNEQEKNA